MADLLKPKQIAVKDGDGDEKEFVISKFDCIFGREIACQYPMTSLPKVGDYRANEELMQRAMAYVAVEIEGGVLQRLSTPTLLKNHITDWEMLTSIERELAVYNISFFRNGRASTFFDGIAQMFLLKISAILTPSSAPSSTPEKPPSMN